MANKLKYAAFGATLALQAGAFAQTLSTEITVDRVVEPAQREAFRPIWAPQPLPVPQQDASLSQAEYDKPGMIVNSLSILPAAMAGDTVALTPYRGYASIGYFPLVNLGANAGFRLVESSKASAGAWMQLDSRKFTREYRPYSNSISSQHAWSGDVDQQTTILNVGADAAYKPNSHSRLGLDLGMMYANVLHPGIGDDDAIIAPADNWRQGAMQLDAKLAWRSHPGRLSYGVSAGVERFGFVNPKLNFGNIIDKHKPAKQTIAQLAGDIGLCREGEYEPWLGLEFDAGIMRSSLKWSMMIDWNLYGYNDFGFSRFQSHARPYVVLGRKAFKARLGANASLGKINGVCPDIRLSWAPSRLPLSAYLNFTGQDAVFNRLSQYFAINPHLSPYQQFDVTKTYWRGDVGAGVGPVSGFSLQGFASVAKVSTYHPYFDGDGATAPLWYPENAGSCFAPSRGTCWMAGVRASYAYKTWGKAMASFTFAGASGEDSFSWYEWKDNAKRELKAEIEAYPVDRLTVNVKYHWRADRYETSAYAIGQDVPTQPNKLGAICDLSIGGAYAITPALTAFLQVDNVLNRSCLMISGLPCQGFNGLAGVSFKF